MRRHHPLACVPCLVVLFLLFPAPHAAGQARRPATTPEWNSYQPKIVTASYQQPTVVRSQLRPVPNTTAAAGPLARAASAQAAPFIDLTNPETDEAQATASGAASDSDLLIGFVIWSVIILSCCGLTALGVRHWQRSRGMLPSRSSQSRVLESLPMGPGRSVSLVELRDIRVIIGCDASGISSMVVAPPSFEEAMEIHTTETDPTQPIHPSIRKTA